MVANTFARLFCLGGGRGGKNISFGEINLGGLEYFRKLGVTEANMDMDGFRWNGLKEDGKL